MLKRIISRSVFPMVAALLLTRESAGRSEIHHGALCNVKASSAPIVAYSPYGVHNTSTTQTATLSCGSILNRDTSSKGVRLTVYDRSATQDVCCTARFEDAFTGDTITSASNCTSGFGPAITTLPLDIPPISVALIYVECTLPPQSINGFSHVASWVVN